MKFMRLVVPEVNYFAVLKIRFVRFKVLGIIQLDSIVKIAGLSY